MVKGAFKSFRHEHYLENNKTNVTITDVFEYQSPFGFLGRIANFLFLKSYMKRFLEERNQILKEYAETDKWKKILKKTNEDS